MPHFPVVPKRTRNAIKTMGLQQSRSTPVVLLQTRNNLVPTSNGLSGSTAHPVFSLPQPTFPVGLPVCQCDNGCGQPPGLNEHPPPSMTWVFPMSRPSLVFSVFRGWFQHGTGRPHRPGPPVQPWLCSLPHLSAASPRGPGIRPPCPLSTLEIIHSQYAPIGRFQPLSRRTKHFCWPRYLMSQQPTL